MQFDYEWLANRLAERGVRKACAVCGASQWVGMGDNQDHLVRLQVYDQSTVHIGESSDLFPLTCVNCGYTRLHSIAPLLDDPANWPRRDNLQT
jgi:hypothetical protein